MTPVPDGPVAWTTASVASVTGGRLLGGPGDTPVVGFSIDSRSLVAGECFVALRDNRDGHDFVVDAFRCGAAAAVVGRVPADPALAPGAPLVLVPDPLTALGELAAHARRAVDPTVVGITGSVGKTGTKDLTAAILGTDRRTHASPASFNNESGLPLAVLGAPGDVDVLVLEMGARFPGNIAELAAIARPQVGVVTNIGSAHAEHLGSPEEVAAVKGELLEALEPGGFAVLNADDAATPRLRQRTGEEVITAGRAGDADVRIRSVTVDDELFPSLTLDSRWGEVTARLAVRGVHQVANAALASTVALRLGLTPEHVSTGLAAALPARLRMELRHSSSGAVVLDDSYNANPVSMRAALESFAELPVSGRRIAVLGSMLELGEQSDPEHADVGGRLASHGVSEVIVVGEEAAPLAEAARREGTLHVIEARDPDHAYSLLAGRVTGADAVLVKGSRAVGLDALAERLAPRGAEADPAPRPGSGAVP
ncbi:MAG: UDP-N-acetylmuramoyl-tripeptide--D-alanyl-D-alanine ligase [Acidimicrobiia bacterium]